MATCDAVVTCRPRAKLSTAQGAEQPKGTLNVREGRREKYPKCLSVASTKPCPHRNGQDCCQQSSFQDQPDSCHLGVTLVSTVPRDLCLCLVQTSPWPHGSQEQQQIIIFRETCLSCLCRCNYSGSLLRAEYSEAVTGQVWGLCPSTENLLSIYWLPVSSKCDLPQPSAVSRNVLQA